MIKTIIGLVLIFAILFCIYMALIMLVLKLIEMLRKVETETLSRVCGIVVQTADDCVYVDCDGQEVYFDKEELPNYQVGDRVLLNVHRGYDKKERLIDECFELRHYES